MNKQCTGCVVSAGTHKPAEALHQQIAEPQECCRSHPHEKMTPMCELRTEIARLTNALARAEAQLAAATQAVQADNLKEPKNGDNWRVVWWNESCRMLLPADKALDSFQSYKNGTMQFTLKQRAHGIGGAA